MGWYSRKATIVVAALAVVGTFVLSLGYGLITVRDWECGRVAEIPGSYWSEAAVDSKGRVHVAFNGVGDYWGLCHGVLDGGDWNLTVVRSATVDVDGVSMVIDSNDGVHLAICNLTHLTEPNEVIYSTWSGAEWRTEIVDTKTQSRDAQLVLDSKGQAHIFYVDPYDSNLGRLKHATKEDTGWKIASVPTNGTRAVWLSSAVIDKNDRVHFLYTYDLYSGDDLVAREVKSYAIFDGDGLDIVDLPYPTSKASMTLGSDGAPRIVLLEETTGTPRYSLATRTTENWTVDEITPAYSLIWSGVPDIEIDDDDRIHLVLPAASPDGNKIYYVTGNANEWNISEVDQPNWDNMRGCSIAIGAGGHVNAFYCDWLENLHGFYLVHATDLIDSETKIEPFLSAGLWASAAAASVLAFSYVMFRRRKRGERLETKGKEM